MMSLIGLHKFASFTFGITQKPFILHHQTWSDDIYNKEIFVNLFRNLKRTGD